MSSFMGHEVSLSGNMLRRFSSTTTAERRGVAERAPHLQWRVKNRLLPVPVGQRPSPLVEDWHWELAASQLVPLTIVKS